MHYCSVYYLKIKKGCGVWSKKGGVLDSSHPGRIPIPKSRNYIINYILHLRMNQIGTRALEWQCGLWLNFWHGFMRYRYGHEFLLVSAM